MKKMGKNKKEHRAKVRKRNERLKQLGRSAEKIYKNMFERLMIERAKEMSGKTESNEIDKQQ